MDPVTMMVASTALTAGATAYGAVQNYGLSGQQAAADAQRQAIQQAWGERQAKNAEVAGEINASEERRQTRLIQGELVGKAGASAGDASVESLSAGIEAEGIASASRAKAAGDQKAEDIRYQSRVDALMFDNQARINRSAARTQLISGLMQAGGQAAGGYTRMSQRYPNLDGPRTQQRTTYG